MRDFDYDKSDQFLTDRHEALMSMDLGKVNAYLKKYGSMVELPDNKIGWMAVHKARTGDLTLPEEERQLSRDWLTQRGLKVLG